MLSENRKLVYAGNGYNDINYRSLSEFHFTALGFFLKILDCLCEFIFFILFFFASLHITKSRKNNNIQITTIYMIYKPVEQTHYCVKFFRLLREKSVKCMCYLKIYIKVYLMHKTNLAQLIKRLRMDRNKIRSGGKIQNGGDHKFCRLTS